MKEKKYIDEWQKAKDDFEEATGLKKPAAKGRILFITWRKPSGLEDAFKKLDKCNEIASTPKADDKFFKAWEAALADMTKKKEAYLKVVDAAIADEKEKAGKSVNYRAFKVFRATIDALAARAEQKYKDYLDKRQLQKQSGRDSLDKFEAVVHTLRMLGTNLKSATAKATLFAKQVLADPTPATYNSGILGAARDMRQSITNVHRFVYADYADLLLHNKDKEIEILDNEKVSKQLEKMSIALYGKAREIEEMAKVSGTTPTNSSLEKMGTDPAKFPNDATAADVKAGVKHFVEQIKKCSEISALLLRFK